MTFVGTSCSGAEIFFGDYLGGTGFGTFLAWDEDCF
jgi:hypothetical protein